MLTALSIRDVVLIDRLDLNFPPGLTVLTGETGAGKSILLDALGLALGARAEQRLVRHGAAGASVTAAFDLAADHPARDLLLEQGLDADGELVLRRVLAADGGSRAFVNDQPATVGLLRQLAARLVEIQGQFEARGLVDPSTHRALLDSFAGLGEAVAGLRAAWDSWQTAKTAEEEAEAAFAEARREEDFLRHAVDELDKLDPKPGEEESLAETRAVMMNREKLIDGLNDALREIGGDRDVADRLQSALKAIERAARHAGGAFDNAVAALERALAEATEARAALEAAGAELDLDPGRLEAIEDRLFTLREIARKHRITVDELPVLRDRLAEKLAMIEEQDENRAKLAEATEAARARYVELAETVHKARVASAESLRQDVMRELPPLKLDKAEFHVLVRANEEASWGPTGMDRVAFEVATNPGTPPGPLAKIASGGELSRLMLALRVVLSGSGSAPALVFDEVDSGVGGATAAAVGERLAVLASDFQVLVVTHSPQVAARGAFHLRVEKEEVAGEDRARTEVRTLDDSARREEIARMLAGKTVTDEARRAADSLLNGEAA